MTGRRWSRKVSGALMVLAAMAVSSKAWASEPVAYVSLAEGRASIVRGWDRKAAQPRLPLLAGDVLVLGRGSRILTCTSGGCRWWEGELRKRIGAPEQRPRSFPPRTGATTLKPGLADAVRQIMDGPSGHAGRDAPFGP